MKSFHDRRDGGQITQSADASKELGLVFVEQSSIPSFPNSPAETKGAGVPMYHGTDIPDPSAPTMRGATFNLDEMDAMFSTSTTDQQLKPEPSDAAL